MAKAVWNGAVLAESAACKKVEGNLYFPPESVNKAFLRSSDTRSVCFWKGRARYYDIEVSGKTCKDAAWYYPKTTPLARHIKDYIAFWKDVEVTEKP